MKNVLHTLLVLQALALLLTVPRQLNAEETSKSGVAAKAADNAPTRAADDVTLTPAEEEELLHNLDLFETAAIFDADVGDPQTLLRSERAPTY